MNCFKRYLLSCLIAMVFFAGFDAYRSPGDMHFGTILVASASWPVFAAVVVGSTIGDVVHDARYGRYGKAG
ncbi:hypothetical protein JQ621_02980 [Bradyrhizobium manausense]|uniref:hypothetical protein n=1 Tax=Bradyrhizobium manausense TaxID=989370 RepID=UPI001BAAEF47|nr:hypothetical protein [Bradyrhizobium manausense]MBR1086434.1 hypothetical protein [Bradyrhizobium manausense]